MGTERAAPLTARGTPSSPPLSWCCLLRVRQNFDYALWVPREAGCCAARLASRAVLICSGVLRSGCDSLSRALSRETCRLWRFANRLSIFFLPRTLQSIYSVVSTMPQIIASVVSISDAIEAAFCSAVLVTLAGSITPAVTRSSYASVEALKPK